ncbi:MAG: hypothetical protein R3F17_05915 [Planctomycetota bacterium]
MKHLLLLSLLALPIACTQKAEPKAEGTQTASTEPRKTGPIEGDYTVNCGCKIDEIGHCGNYVLVEGHAYEIQGDLGLGKMEWCSTGAKHAHIKGVLNGANCTTESLKVTN